MSQPWLEPENFPLPQKLRKIVGGHPIVAQTLADLGINDPDEALAFLNPHFYKPSFPTELPGLSLAADRLEQCLKANETILIWGDFDVDGQTATTLLVEALRDLGASVQYHIPVRETEGHGINLHILKQYLTPDQKTGQNPGSRRPSILLTCDTGISAHLAIDFANSVGVDIIITDHHEPGDTIPNAYAVINPHLLPTSEHRMASLPGVGVAFLLIKELYKRRGNQEKANRYLDLVALGIVVDIARLTGDTRYLLQLGLKALRITPRLGLQALYKISNLKNPENLDESHIGFSIGPRLNALGRLSDANLVVEFLTTEDIIRADTLAIEIDGLNHHRRLLTEQVYQAAMAQIEREPDNLTFAALVLAHPGWPAGILGLVASRLAEQYQKPTILLNIQKDGKASGSARSVAHVEIMHAIRQQADLLDRYGGHAGAAGLSLPAENIPEFKVRLSRTIRQMTETQELQPRLKIAAYVSLSDLNLELVDEIQRLAPFGHGNPPVTLASRNIQWISETEIGRNQEHRRLVVEDQEGYSQEILWWRGAYEALPPRDVCFDLAYQVRSNTFKGERQLQLEWIDYRLPEKGNLKTDPQPKDAIEITDYRLETYPKALLSAITTQDSVQIWAEGEINLSTNTMNREDLIPGPALAIWTTPPDSWVLKNAIRRVEPNRIYWFANDPGLDSLQPFCIRLAGLIKNILHKEENTIPIEHLAAAMSHTTATIQMGLLWLQAYGSILFEFIHEDIITISPARTKKNPELERINRELRGMLVETAAFRKYLTYASTDSLQNLITKSK